MEKLGRYDQETQMFVEAPREPDPEKLGFLRWLGEQGRLEHEVAGLPNGEYAKRGRNESSSTESSATNQAQEHTIFENTSIT